ncbi:hypothetical protein FKM82_026981 [Ascaphus truei]
MVPVSGKDRQTGVGTPPGSTAKPVLQRKSPERACARRERATDLRTRRPASARGRAADHRKQGAEVYTGGAPLQHRNLDTASAIEREQQAPGTSRQASAMEGQQASGNRELKYTLESSASAQESGTGLCMRLAAGLRNSR